MVSVWRNYWHPRSAFWLLIPLTLSWLQVSAAGRVNLGADNVAVSGYDLLSYFEAQAEPGNTKFSSHYRGATYLFSTAAHLESFESDPQRFLPAYGGYCAYGITMGKQLSIDPEVYDIVAGRLYLLLNRATKKIWQHDKNRNISTADQLWLTTGTSP